MIWLFTYTNLSKTAIVEFFWNMLRSAEYDNVLYIPIVYASVFWYGSWKELDD